MSVSEDWDSSDDGNGKKNGVTKEWESNEVRTRKSIGQRLRQAVKQRVESAREARAYRKSPEYMEKKIDKLNQQAELEVAKSKIEIAKAKRAKARGVRMEETFKPLKKMGGDFGMGSGGILSAKDHYKGMDNMLGFGESEIGRATKSKRQQKSGFDDLFGI